MIAPDAFHANLQRGALLLQQDRFKEALSFTQAAIAANPDSARGYAQLALCWNGLPRERAKAIPAIDRAIGLEPAVSYYVGLKGWFYVCLGRYRAALKAAQQGLAINPICPQSLNSLANAYTKMALWKKAEAACHRILELDPNNAPGLNLLAQAQRHLGRWKEARETVDRLLAQYPNNAFGQTNAGFGALAAGDHLRANEHFLNALRMDPHFDLARRGLLQALHARLWITRINLRLFAFMRRPASWTNLLLTLGLCIVGTVLLLLAAGIGTMLDSVYPHAGVIFCVGLIVLFTLYLLLSVLSGLLANFLLLFDPVGRHALNGTEKFRSIFSAGMIGYVIFYCFSLGAWSAALGIAVLVIIMIITIQLPLIRERLRREREEEARRRELE